MNTKADAKALAALEAECERLADALDRQSVITGDYIARCQGLADERDRLRDECEYLANENIELKLLIKNLH